MALGTRVFAVLGTAVTMAGLCSFDAHADAANVSAILDRWEPIAVQAEAHQPSWRELFGIQLALMPTEMLQRLQRILPANAGDAKAEYARFTQAFVNVQANIHGNGSRATEKSLLKLGSTSSDLVFVPIPPCRILDTRVVGGPIAAGTYRQNFYYNSVAGFSWSSLGGTPGLANSACPGTTLNSAGGTLGNVAPAAAVATVTAVNPTIGPANLVVWGGALPVPTTSALNWASAGDVIANTTTIPWGGRTGSTMDYSVYLNAVSGSTDVVVDVVGYFVENAVTALQCVTVTASGTGTITNGSNAVVSSPLCTAGYSKTGSGCSVAAPNLGYLVETSPGLHSDCVWTNNTGGSVAGSNYQAEAVCCRVPGQ